jgi:hypothetical protein
MGLEQRPGQPEPNKRQEQPEEQPNGRYRDVFPERAASFGNMKWYECGLPYDLRDAGISPSWRRHKAEGKGLKGLYEEGLQMQIENIDQELSSRRRDAQEHFAKYVNRKHPELTSDELVEEEQVILMPDVITKGRHILDLLVKLDEADAEIRRTNPEWKSWYERD